MLILIQTNNYLFLSIWCIIAALLYIRSDQSGRLFIMTSGLFGFGFYAYLYVTTYLLEGIHWREIHILLDRLSLVLILIPLLLLSLVYKSSFIHYLKKPNWDNIIQFPFILSGAHHVKLKFFLPIALIINIIAMLPFIVSNGWSFIQEFFIIAVIFSFTNAILEEFVWRGALLSRFSEQIGETWAIILTSLGFGLQHYSLGFPWSVCIAFSFGGFFYGAITVKSKSIIPSIIWHIALNFLMVFSGLIVK
ncbi:CPBP family intramembrane glutamic endopeptidase [Metabacillus fastidiosus]|uniref:CPBP family intramembrane metalloprotease n=1 Tax=Metabacillus fastidiosus TaxID=1458 RepID=A0ABU6NXK4_9BACI|nr:CPBP family intramembrane glutamic endopeptidase [Metabacillus fastidiosus]MED4401418.1 CPBP family intramembrane metalloprotease [Metabacillus fastidiosus]MED4463053.1 CPBP family intramembrane metalloprotease [Metabacillus fastidiosus]